MTIPELDTLAGEHSKTVWSLARRAANERLDIRLSFDDLVSEGLYWLTVALDKWEPGTGNKFAFVHQVVNFGIIQYERKATGDKRWSTFRGGIYPVEYDEFKDSRRSDDMESAVALMDHRIKLGRMSERERAVIETFMAGMTGPDARRFLFMSRSMYDRTLKTAREVYRTDTPTRKINTYTKTNATYPQR